MPCGFNGCDYKYFFVDMDNYSDSQCVNLVCLECKHSRQVSCRNYELMCDLENHLVEEAMRYGVNWTEESIRKELMQYTVTGDMK